MPRLQGPAGLMFAGTLAYAFGRGIYGTSIIVFFSLTLRFSATQIGAALSGAGIAALLIALPTGYLADRWGSRRLAIMVAVVQSGLVIPFLITDSYAALLPCVIAIGAADRANSIVRRTLVSHVIGESERVRFQAYLRSTANVGMSLAALIVAPLLAVASRMAFTFLLSVTMGAFAVVAVVTARLPAGSRPGPPPPPTGVSRQEAPRARTRRLTAFAGLGLVNGLLALHISILNVALPLWITKHTAAPTWIVSALILVNTVLAVAFQVTLSRTSSTVRGAAATLATSSLFTALACVLFAATADRAGLLVVAGLLLAVIALTIGELLQSAGEWGLSFGLAPVRSQGRYVGAFSIGTALQDIAGPIVVVALAIVHVPGGWLTLSLIVLVSGGSVVSLTRWAARGGPASELIHQPRPRGLGEAPKGTA